jgi:hypothetical protein
MSQQSDFLLARARDERAKAEASSLANVRDSHMRAADAWDALAARSVRSDLLRVEEEARKAEIKNGDASYSAY